MAIKLADDTEADVRGLQTTEAAAVGASKPKQWVGTTDTLRVLMMNAAGDAILIGVSDDSKQCLLAGTQTLTGQKTFELPIQLAEPGESSIGNIGVNGDDIELNHTDTGDLIIQQSNAGGGDLKLKTLCGGIEADSASGIILKTGGGNTVLNLNNSQNAVLTPGSYLGGIDGGGLTFDASNNASFSADLTVDTDKFVVDVSEGYVGIGTTTPEESIHIESSTADEPKILLKNTNDGSGGAQLNFEHFSASPADNDDIGKMKFTGYNDAGTPDEIVYGRITVKSSDVSDGTEDGEMLFMTYSNGSESSNLTLKSGNVGIGTNNPDGLLHLFAGSAGTVDSAGQFTLENDGDVLLQLLSPATDTCRINLGDNNNVGVSYISQNHSTGALTISNNEVLGSILIEQTGSGDIKLDTACGGALIETTGGDITLSSTDDIILSGTNIGINESSPDCDLHITSDSPRVRLDDSDGGYCELFSSDGTLTIEADKGATQAASNIAFTVDNDEKARFMWNGRFGLGTNSPNELFDMRGSDLAIRIQDTDNDGYTLVDGTDGSLMINADAANTVASSFFAVRVDNQEEFRVEDDGGIFMRNLKTGATQAAAGAALDELWVTSSHAILPDYVVMIGT